MICVLLALHALSAVPEKLRPMLSSASPITVPLFAAYAGMAMLGSNTNTMHIHNTRERKRRYIFFIFFLPSFLSSLCDFYY